jgi:glutamine amidotransferase
MCRLYGFLANEPTKVECALVLAQNSLLTQSRGDGDDSGHPDGWGIAYYENGRPSVERRETAAFEDLHFSETAERVFARTVIAHVRRATVGARVLANAHPYTYGSWAFAHNGTLAGFTGLEPHLREETDAELLELRHGTNDSELVFLWLLSRLGAAGAVTDPAGTATGRLVGVFASALADLIAMGERAEPERVSRLNFLLTDGRRLLASRWQRDLHLVERDDVHDCEICGIPHVHHHEGRRYRAVVLASEPLTHETWRRVPEASVVAIDADLAVRIEPLPVRAR